MPDQAFTIIDDGTPVEVRGTVADGAMRLASEAVRTALGWELKAQGLCQGSTCIPVSPGLAGAAETIDLAELARMLGRPLALDLDEGAAYFGVGAQQRAQVLESLEAPDFALPDLEGREHSLRQHRGKKVLLVAWASW